MRAGRLDQRVVIEEQVTTQDALGQPTNTWQEVATVFANVSDLRGREFFDAQQYNAETTTRFLMRYRSDVTHKMRIVFRSENYNIAAIIRKDSRGREMEVLAGKGVNNG